MLEGLSRIDMSERFSLPHIHQPDKWCQGLSRVLELRFAFFDFRRRDVGQLPDLPHQLGSLQHAGKLCTEQAALQRALYRLNFGANERIAAFQVVIQKRERRAQRERVEPEGQFGELDRKSVV